MTGATVTGVTFADLVTAATLGLSRKELAISELAGPAAGYAGALDRDDPAAALLDAAALLTVARRAGVRPARDVACPAGVAGDGARELSARATRILRRIGGADLAAGFSAADSELLADLLTAAREAGYTAPAPLLPDLLDAAVRTAALRPVIAGVLGARGRWLAGHRPDWRQFTEQAAAHQWFATAGEAGHAGDAGEAWRTGNRAGRRAHLAALRDRDPAAARELLAAGWARETGEDRATLLPVLAHRLSPADEEFLESVLADRAGAVRDLARRLLARLPGSAYGRRAAERAAAALRLERSGPRRRLVATLPEEPDAAAARDGLGGRPPTPSIGARAWLLTQVIAAAPLDSWTERFGLAADELARLPVAGGLAADVHAGWRLAAISQRVDEWARALLAVADPAGTGNRPPAAWPSDVRLAAVLPPADRAERAAALLLTGRNFDGTAQDHQAAFAEVAGSPVPWPPVLAGAVLTVLRHAVTLTALPRLPRALLDAAKRGLPATGDRDYAAELTRLAGTYPQSWSPLLYSAAETIALRRAFLEEIR